MHVNGYWPIERREEVSQQQQQQQQQKSLVGFQRHLLFKGKSDFEKMKPSQLVELNRVVHAMMVTRRSTSGSQTASRSQH